MLKIIDKLTLVKKITIKILNFKITWRGFCNLKIENTVPKTYVINNLNGE